MSSLIRTPDQRLRVFISSTLGELAPERAAVRAAVERLHLTPVMFELGARPHPPRELYRAYLDQSHVFLGIYWQRYGWVAPGEEVSGLEDEYRLAGDRPRLLYLKEPAPDREARLTELVNAFQTDDRASYRRFSTPDELAALVEDDLALMLSERFETAGARTTGHPERDRQRAGAPPAPLTPTIGRDREIDAVVAALRGGSRLVTITGAGGIGKTRLAVEVARRIDDDYPDGVDFVPLAGTTEVDGAMHAIVDSLGTRAEGGTLADAVTAHLRDRRVLLVLDNVEQIGGLGPVLVDVLERSPDVQALVTSRRALRVRGEWEYAVGTLPVPGPAGRVADPTGEPALHLFVERARAASRDFALTDANTPAVVEIVRRLDGLPLAIELAAARIRVLSPQGLLDRLGSSLDVLAAGADDLPERQRTLRATLDWSHELLTDAERALFARLAVFVGGWTLDAAEAVCEEGDSPDVLETMASLLDKSLVAADDDTHGGEPRFRMLETIRSYASERLSERGGETEYRCRHLAWCRGLATRAQPYLCGPGQREWVARMDPERANLRQAVATALALGDYEAVIELAWNVVVLYFVSDAVDEPDSWLQQVAGADPVLDDVADAKLRSLLALTRIHHGDYAGVHDALLGPLAVFRRHGMDFETAVVLHQLGFVHFRLDDDADAARAALHESSELFESIGHDWGVGLAEAMLGSLYAAVGDLEQAEDHQRRALDRAGKIDSDQQTVQALGQIALIRLLQERTDAALELVLEAAPILQRNGYRTETANALDVLAVVAHERGADDDAAWAVCVAAAERARLGVRPWPTIQAFIDRIRRWVRQALGDTRFAEIDAAASDADVFATLATMLVALTD